MEFYQHVFEACKITHCARIVHLGEMFPVLPNCRDQRVRVFAIAQVLTDSVYRDLFPIYRSGFWIVSAQFVCPLQ